MMVDQMLRLQIVSNLAEVLGSSLDPFIFQYARVLLVLWGLVWPFVLRDEHRFAG